MKIRAFNLLPGAVYRTSHEFPRTVCVQNIERDHERELVYITATMADGYAGRMYYGFCEEVELMGLFVNEPHTWEPSDDIGTR